MMFLTQEIDSFLKRIKDVGKLKNIEIVPVSPWRQ